MPYRSQSNDLTLTQVLDRLSQKSVIAGLLIVGSLPSDRFKPFSDYDLLIVLDEPPIAFHVGCTMVDGRLTDLIFTTLTQLETLLSGPPVPINEFEGRILQWLRIGDLRFDRTGRLAEMQQQLQEGDHWWQSAGTNRAIHERWSNTSYNILQNRRLLGANDPVYNMAVDLRLLYNLSFAWDDYFLVRHIPGKGDKGEIRYLQIHDPDYLTLFHQALAESNRQQKQVLYEQIAEYVFKPYRPLWGEGVTTIGLGDGEWSEALVEDAEQFWEQLLEEQLLEEQFLTP